MTSGIFLLLLWKIHKNDRICQFRIHEVMPEVEIVEVEELNNPDRGGLGSTGRQ